MSNQSRSQAPPRRVVSAIDCGKIVNPRLAERQIRGSMIFGIGMALMEEAARHPGNLRVLSDNLADYAVPVHADIPEMDVLFIDKPDLALVASERSVCRA